MIERLGLHLPAAAARLARTGDRGRVFAGQTRGFRHLLVLLQDAETGAVRKSAQQMADYYERETLEQRFREIQAAYKAYVAFLLGQAGYRDPQATAERLERTFAAIEAVGFRRDLEIRGRRNHLQAGLRQDRRSVDRRSGAQRRA